MSATAAATSAATATGQRQWRRLSLAKVQPHLAATVAQTAQNFVSTNKQANR